MTETAIGFAEQLRQASEPDWTAATRHRFVRELADDTIAPADYARYLILDFAFIDTLVSLVAYAVALAPDMARKQRYAGFLNVLTGEENDYFERSFAALGVSETQWRVPLSHPVVDGFRALMHEPVGADDYAGVLAVLLPVEWVYLTWASEQRDATPARAYLKEWIDLHVDPGFAEFVGWMRAEMDALGAAADAATAERLTATFTRAVELEVRFFDAAYD